MAGRSIDPRVIAIAVGAGVALVVVWQLGKAGRAVGQAISEGAVNPASPNNLAYRGVNSVGASLTGDRYFDLGSWIWEKLNPEAAQREREAIGQAQPVQPVQQSTAWLTDAERSFSDGANNTPTFGYEPASWYYTSGQPLITY